MISLLKTSENKPYNKRQVNLDFFLLFNQDREAYEKALQAQLEYEESQRPLLECKECILDELNRNPFDIRTRCHCEYRDIRDAVIAKLKLEKVIKLGWAVSSEGYLVGAYFLNKQK